MNIKKWIGSRPDGLRCYGRKKDAPQLQPWETLVRIQFRFETVYCVITAEGKLDGKIKTAEVFTNGKCLIGLADPYQPRGASAQYPQSYPDECAFYNAIWERWISSRPLEML
jgi:hypothetical protein